MLKKDGTIEFQDGFVATRFLTRTRLLSLQVGENPCLVTDHGEYTTYKVSTQRLGDAECICTLYFQNETLSEVHLHPRWSERPAKWTLDTVRQEADVKKLNDTLLRQALGDPPYEYDWGTVESVCDAKTGSSEIIVRYRVVRAS